MNPVTTMATPFSIQIATISPANDFGIIMRRDHAPTLTVQAVSAATTAVELEAAVRPVIDEIVSELGRGFWWEWGGETESSGDAQEALFAFVPLALLPVALILARKRRR